MLFTRRPLTPVEQARHCPWCDAEPGQRCTNPDGKLFQPGEHSARRTGVLVGTPPGKVRPRLGASVGVEPLPPGRTRNPSWPLPADPPGRGMPCSEASAVQVSPCLGKVLLVVGLRANRGCASERAKFSP